MRFLPKLSGGLILVSLATALSAQTTAFPKFPPSAIWNQDISARAADPNSTTMIKASGSWGTGGTAFQIDFSMHVLYTAGQSTTLEPLVQESGYYLPDCDTGLSVPLPSIGGIEGSANYTCNLSHDCHLFVVDGTNLFESYKSTVDSNGLNSLCLVKWRLDLVYPPNGRGNGCTSADAAGFPMAPLIFGPDEVYAALQVNNGDLGHAIRFILPNNRMRSGFYVYPASHNGSPNSLSADAIPYGAHLRLQAGFDISGFNPAAQVILRTLKKYGMFLADGGSIPLTFDDGMFAAHQWSDTDINIDSHSLYGVALSNFDVMPLGTPIAYNNSDPSAECLRGNFVNQDQTSVLANPQSFTGAWLGFSFGLPGDIPMVMTLNGSLIPVVYRPSSAYWYFDFAGFGNYGAQSTEAVQFGSPGDIPQIVRIGGDDHIAVYRPSANAVYLDLDNKTYAGSNLLILGSWQPRIPATQSQIVSTPSSFAGIWYGFSFGLPGDIPLLIQLAAGGPKLPVVFRGGNWYIDLGGYANYSVNQLKVVQFGLPGDIPEVVSWNGSDHFTVYRPSTGQTLLDTDNQSYNGSNVAVLP